MKNRRDFFRKALSGTAAAAFMPELVMAKESRGKTKSNIAIGLASISMSKLSLKEMMETAKKCGLMKVSLKSMHAPLDNTAEQLAQVRSTAESLGIKIISAGVIYMKTNAEVDNAFEYAKNLGILRIIGVPNYELLDYVEEKIKQYDICLAIHNHGPDNLPYETPFVAYDKVKSRDKRFGLCVDPGHIIRNGGDPIDAIKKVYDRLQEMHIWDCSKAAKDGWACPAGTGVMKIEELLKTLNKLGFNGCMNIEYLGNPEEDRILNVANTAGYLNGILKTLD
jgi:inosose dehydratase